MHRARHPAFIRLNTNRPGKNSALTRVQSFRPDATLILEGRPLSASSWHGCLHMSIETKKRKRGRDATKGSP
jgi:hypothetical protein